MAAAGTIKKLAKLRNISPEDLIREALAATNGNEFKAAVALGVYPRTVHLWRLKIENIEKKVSQN